MNDYEQKVRGVGMYAPKNSKPYHDDTESFIVTDKMLDDELKSRFDMSLEELQELIETYAPERLI